MNYEKIKALIAAGEKATQGAFSHSRKDMHTFCAYTGKQQSFIYPPEPSERITVETEYPVEDAQFFAKAANARDELKTMYDELMRLREELSAIAKQLITYHNQFEALELAYEIGEPERLFEVFENMKEVK